MKLRCEKNHMIDAVNTVIKAVSPKSSIPILEGILLTADTDHLTLVGNDLEISIETVIPAVVEENGSIVLEAKRLFEMLRKLPNDVISLSVDEKNNAELSSQNALYHTMALSSDGFPEVKTVQEEGNLRIKAGILKNMIRQTLFAVSDTENRQILTGSLFEVKDNALYVVSLDGFRMAIRKEKMENLQPMKLVIPGKTLSELVKILPEGEETVTITFSDKHAMISFENTKIITRLIEGEFFDYEKIIPTEKNVTVHMVTEEIRASVERAEPLINASDMKKNPIKLEIKENTVQLDCQTSAGKVNDVIDIPNCGGELEIGFNHKYLQDALRECGCEEIIMEFNSALSPCLIKPKEGDAFLYMVLPVRLKG